MFSMYFVIRHNNNNNKKKNNKTTTTTTFKLIDRDARGENNEKSYHGNLKEWASAYCSLST